MPKFICPITRCLHHNGHDCEYEMITVSPKSNDFDVTIVCLHQEDPPGKCDYCVKVTSPNSKICTDCMIDIM